MEIVAAVLISCVVIGLCLHARHVTRIKYTLRALHYARQKREEAYLLDMIEHQRERMRVDVMEENKNDKNS